MHNSVHMKHYPINRREKCMIKPAVQMPTLPTRALDQIQEPDSILIQDLGKDSKAKQAKDSTLMLLTNLRVVFQDSILLKEEVPPDSRTYSATYSEAIEHQLQEEPNRKP